MPSSNQAGKGSNPISAIHRELDAISGNAVKTSLPLHPLSDLSGESQDTKEGKYVAPFSYQLSVLLYRDFFDQSKCVKLK